MLVLVLVLVLVDGVVVDANGEPVDGDVDLSWTFLDTPEEIGAAPGNLATDIAGVSHALESFGMVEVQLSIEGTPVDAKGGMELSMPIRGDTKESSDAGLYRFDPVTAAWETAPGATVRNGRLIAMVPGRGWWNCDKPLLITGCVEGKLTTDLDPKTPLPAAFLTSGQGTASLFATRSTWTPLGGTYCTNVRVGTKVRITTAIGQRGDRCYYAVNEAMAVAAGNRCDLPSRTCVRSDAIVKEIPCPPASPEFEMLRLLERFKDTTKQADSQRPSGVGVMTLRLNVPETGSASLTCGGWPVPVRFVDGEARNVEVWLDRPCELTLPSGEKQWIQTVDGGTAELFVTWLASPPTPRPDDSEIDLLRDE